MSDTRPNPAPDLRVMYVGLCETFSTIPLQHLLAAGANVCAVVTPQPAACLPPGGDPQGETIVDLAAARAIAVEYVRDLKRPATLERLAAYEPDVILVACFPYILPRNLLELPRLGCFNLHPSLLPAYRGPAPLFWQLRCGEERTGVTLHRMTEQVDAGDIVAQAAVALPNGLTGPEADALLAGRGARLVLETLPRLAEGALRPRPQREDDSSYFPWPAAGDFQVSTGWPARRAFNFIRGTAEWGRPHSITIGREQFFIERALSYSTGHELGEPYVLLGRELWLRFSPGVLHARLAVSQGRNIPLVQP